MDSRTEVFLDAAYAIALSSPGDQHHARAILLADELEAAGTRLVTTRAILLEIGNALAKLRHRQAATVSPGAAFSSGWFLPCPHH